MIWHEAAHSPQKHCCTTLKPDDSWLHLWDLNFQVTRWTFRYRLAMTYNPLTHMPRSHMKCWERKSWNTSYCCTSTTLQTDLCRVATWKQSWYLPSWTVVVQWKGNKQNHAVDWWENETQLHNKPVHATLFSILQGPWTRPGGPVGLISWAAILYHFIRK